MPIRTFYWHARVLGRARMLSWQARGRPTDSHFRIGNAGDVFNRDLISFLYGRPALNVENEGRRLLAVGSTAHRLRDGDLVCGIGTKGEPIPPASQAHVHVRAVRGPLTLAALADAGHDVSGVRSQLDPGLMLRFMLTSPPPARPGRVVVIPHYRDRQDIRQQQHRGLRVLDIDSQPLELGRAIARAELVYASSLHGMVFAHALGRPCVPFATGPLEPDLKYRDYFASVGLPWTGPLPTLAQALRAAKPTSPLDLTYTIDDFAFPGLDELRSLGIVTPDRAA